MIYVGSAEDTRYDQVNTLALPLYIACTVHTLLTDALDLLHRCSAINTPKLAGGFEPRVCAFRPFQL